MNVIKVKLLPCESSVKNLKTLLFDYTLSGTNILRDVTQTLKSVEDPGNTFDLNPKWARTLPSLIYLSWDI